MRSDPRLRRRLILRLLGRGRIRSQAELGDLLEREGISVNQGTLSRDLRELGVVKGPDGYAVAAEAPGAPGELDRALDEWLLDAAAAQNQVVVHTPAGGAAPLALAVDRARLSGVVGTVAGDDTVLVICTDRRRAASLADELGARTEVRP